MNIIEAWDHPDLFGGVKRFEDRPSWRPHRARVKATHGIPLDDTELVIFQKATGRTTPRPEGYDETVVITGRQSGKSQIGGLEAVITAATIPRSNVLVVAQDHRSATRVLFGFIRELFEEVPALRSEIVRETSDVLELSNGSTIAVYPCTSRSIRGTRNDLVVVDEIAHFITSEGRPADEDVLIAARPSLAMKRGRMLILSSPYWQSGALWNLHAKHYGREDSSTLVWVSDSPSMNPKLPADYLERMRIDDPEAYRSEVLGEFRAGVSTLFDTVALDACVDKDIREREPSKYREHVAFVDASSGSGQDAFALSVAHAEGDRVVSDVVRSWKPPFSPSAVIAEVCELVKRYGITEVQGDAYAPGFVEEAFDLGGIVYRRSEMNRSELYLEILPAVNARRVLLLDDPETLRELRGLERRRGSQGRDKVDHRSGGHDDRANAVAGAVVAAGAYGGTTITGIWKWEPGMGPFSGGPLHGQVGMLTYRDGKPWSGICEADRDSKGRTTNFPAVFKDGKIVEYLTHEKFNQLAKETER